MAMNYYKDFCDVLSEIFQDTRHLSKAVHFLDTKKMIDNTKVYECPKDIHLEVNDIKLPKIEMYKGGTIEIALKYANKCHVAALNFADAIIPGGFVFDGAPTQEETLCRCTNLYETLISKRCKAEYYTPNRKSRTGEHKNERTGHVYTDRLIYAPDVDVFKDDIGYDYLKKPVNIDIITCPAPSCFFIDDNEALRVYMNRIEGIVKVAIDNNADTIVLGAWGCGAFGQRPELVAEAFARVLTVWGNYFNHIVFAIRPTIKGTTNRTYNIFKDAFDTYYFGGVEE